MAKNTKLSHKGKEIFIGLDVHKKSYSVVAVADHFDKIVIGAVPASPEILVKTLRKKFAQARLNTVYEAGFSGFELHRYLKKCDINNIVVNPASIPVVSSDRVKTDKRDAHKMAIQLKSGFLRSINIPSRVTELQRCFHRTRQQLVESRSKIGNQIKSKLMQFGFIPFDDKSSFSLKWLQRIKEQSKLPNELSLCISSLMSIFKSLK